MNYQLPSLNILERNNEETHHINEEEYINKIEKIIRDFRVSAKVESVSIGPISVQFELALKEGTRVEKIFDLEPEFKFYLGCPTLKVVGPREGKSTIGINMPNPNKYDVLFSKIMRDEKAKLIKMNVPVIIGQNDIGENIINDLSKLQHILIGGCTGSGKSVFINSLVSTVLFTKKPDEVRLALIDTKIVELSNYNGIPNLLCPVVHDINQAVILLQKMVNETEKRYRMFSSTGTKKIEEYNEYVEKWNKSHPDEKIEKLPYIVMVIDDLFDIMMNTYRRETESSLYKLVKNGDEAGIHLVMSVQRPSHDLLSTIIKDSIHSRICFQVGISEESKIVLDEKGAELLKDRGEAIYKPLHGSKVLIKSAIISESDNRNIIEYTKKLQGAPYNEEFLKQKIVEDESVELSEDEKLYNQIVGFVINQQKASTSLLQTRFKIRYNKAATMMDKLEDNGIIGPPTGNSKPREVLIQNLTIQKEIENQKEPKNTLYRQAKELVIRKQKASNSLLREELKIDYITAEALLKILEEKGVVSHSKLFPRRVLIKYEDND